MIGMMMMIWHYNNTPITSLDQMPEGTIGFTYLITFNETTPKGVNFSYLGCKQVVSNRGVSTNAWKNYNGSSKNVTEKLKSGELTIKSKEILQYAISKQQLAYLESREILCRGLLEDESSYNMWVKAKLFKAHILEPKPMKILPKKKPKKK